MITVEGVQWVRPHWRAEADPAEGWGHSAGSGGRCRLSNLLRNIKFR